MLAAWEMQVPASSAGAVCPWLGTLTPCSGSLRCLGATYLGGRLGNPLTSLQRLQCLEVGSWGVGSPSFCCQGCASLVGYMCIQQWLTEMPGTACQVSGLSGPCTGLVRLWCPEVSSQAGGRPTYCCRGRVPLVGYACFYQWLTHMAVAACLGAGLGGPAFWFRVTAVSQIIF